MKKAILKQHRVGHTIYIPIIEKRYFLFFKETVFFASNELFGCPYVYFFSKQEALDFLSDK
jgi:hypothetical protein